MYFLYNLYCKISSVHVKYQIYKRFQYRREKSTIRNKGADTQGQLEGAGRNEVADTLALAASQSRFASSSYTFAVAGLHL